MAKGDARPKHTATNVFGGGQHGSANAIVPAAVLEIGMW